MRPSGLAAIFCLLSLAALHPAALAEDAYVEGEVLVTFRAGVAEPSARTRMSGRAMRLAETYDRISAERGRVHGMVRDKSRSTKDLIAELKTDPTVETAEPNYLKKVFFIRPNDTYLPRQWALENTGQAANLREGTSGVDTRFMQAWNLSRTTAPAQDIVICVADTGVDIAHPDLAPNLWTNTGEIPGNGVDDDGNGRVDDVHGYDFAGNTGTMTDSSDHGTHVAGIAAAAGRNAMGITGVQFKAKIMPLKVSVDGDNMPTSAVIAACNYAVAMKNRGVNIAVFNASYGGASYVQAEFNAVAALRDAGIIVCAAAGNDASNNDLTPTYPANFALTNIITVASIDARNALSSFSNHGASSVDLAAPGSEIFSTSPTWIGGTQVSVTIGSTRYAAGPVAYSPVTTLTGVTGGIHDCGIGGVGNFPAAVNGNIALIRRGELDFSVKVANAKTAGAIGVIIYNNVDNEDSFTLGSSGAWLPTVQVTLQSGNAILSSLPASGTLVSASDPGLPYQYMNGTSMATPCVSGAVAFAALNFPTETMAQRIARVVNNTTAVPALAGKTITGGRLDLLKIIDTDLDGLPDWWETEYFGTITAQSASGDPDGDGFDNLAEFMADTDPKSGGSRLAISSVQPSGDDLLLGFPANAERRYQIEWSDTLLPPWTPLGPAVTGSGGTLQITDPGALESVPQRFYRLNLLTD